MATQKKKNNSTKAIIILILVIIVLAAIAFLTNYLRKIPDNDPGASGNSSGNLNNNGLFCEDDGVIYFANPYDSGSLYSMNPDQTELKLLYKSNCRNINATGNHLYFCMESPDGGTGLGFVIKTSGIYRSTKKGTDIKCLTGDPTLIMSLAGNYLYYQTNTGAGVGLKKISAVEADPDPITVEQNFSINPACSINGSIFFGGTQKDHYLYALNTTNDSVVTLWDGDVWNPVYDNGYFYYMDISKDYRICRYSQSAGTIEILTHDRADTFNVRDGYVYYSTSQSDNPGLYRMNGDGSSNEMVASGIICDINMTSTYTYFREFNTTVPMYYVPTYGANQAFEFSAASEAAMKENK